MNVHADKAATVEGCWLDINLPVTGSHGEEVESFIAEILSKEKNIKIEKKEYYEKVTEKINMDNISEGLLEYFLIQNKL